MFYQPGKKATQYRQPSMFEQRLTLLFNQLAKDSENSLTKIVMAAITAPEGGYMTLLSMDEYINPQ